MARINTKEKEDKKLPTYPDPDLPPVKYDFRRTFSWRIFRIMAEFVEGFQFITDFSRKAVAIFGSTRSPRDGRYYKEAEKLSRLLAREKYSVITGGGPGIMEAGNKGAFEEGGKSIGINIELPEGQRVNRYVTHPIGFHYFFTRKVMLSFASSGYVFFPGGLGTLDEFFEMITLVQTKKLSRSIVIVLVGKEYWEPLIGWLKTEAYEKHGAIDEKDLKIFHIVDTAEDAFSLIKKGAPGRKQWK